MVGLVPILLARNLWNMLRVVTSTGKWVLASFGRYERRRESEFTLVSVSINPYLENFGGGISDVEAVINTRLHLLFQPLYFFSLPFEKQSPAALFSYLIF